MDTVQLCVPFKLYKLCSGYHLPWTITSTWWVFACPGHLDRLIQWANISLNSARVGTVSITFPNYFLVSNEEISKYINTVSVYPNVDIALCFFVTLLLLG
jgi:hypothetical protein